MPAAKATNYTVGKANTSFNNTENTSAVPIPTTKGRPKTRTSTGGFGETVSTPLQSSESKILTAISNLDEKMVKQHSQLHQAIATQNTRIESLAGDLESVVQRVAKCEEAIQNSGTTLDIPEFEKLQIELRRLNLLFFGFREIEGESEQILKDTITDFCEKALQIKDIMIDVVYRIGRKTDGLCRQIKVRFCFLKHRNQVFAARNLPRAEKSDRAYRDIYVNEDLPPVTQERRKLLRAHCKSANAAGATTRLLGDKLWIQNVAYIIDNKNELVQFKTDDQGPRQSTSSASKRQRDSMDSMVTSPGNSKTSPSKLKPKKKPNTREFNFAFANTGRRTFSSSSSSTSSTGSQRRRNVPYSSSSLEAESPVFETGGMPSTSPANLSGDQLQTNCV